MSQQSHSSFPRPSAEVLELIQGLYVRKGTEISLIAGSIDEIGDLLHYLIMFPAKTDEDKLLQLKASFYLAEGAAMTENGPNILMQLIEMMRDSLKVNTNIAMDRSGGFMPSAGGSTSFDERKPDGKRGQFESAKFEPKGDGK